MPVRHGDDPPDTGIAERGRRAEAVAVERVELRIQPLLARRLHEQREVVAPVAGHDGIRAARADLRDIRREILDPADRVEFVAGDRHVRAPRGQRLPRERADVVAEAVVLVQQIDLAQRAVARHHVRERGHPHPRVRVEAKMPETAARAGQRRIVCRIVEEQHPVVRIARVQLVERRDERGRDSRTVALRDEADMPVRGRAQLHERLLRAALAIEHDELERMRAVAQLHAARRVDLLDAEAQVALDRRARVRERARHPFDQRDPHRLAAGKRGRHQHPPRAQHERAPLPPLHRLPALQSAREARIIGRRPCRPQARQRRRSGPIFSARCTVARRP